MKPARIVLVTLGLLALAGVWLFVAPFGLSYQPIDAHWQTATINDMATGGALALICLISLATYCALSARDLLKRAPASDGSAGKALIVPAGDAE